ncbi:MAG: MBL fold metallo-hydrolase [Planctomycetes bacterium]|nr:MBL fold metallo-hydrolase [Planctomycetota bacterium]
MRIGSWELASVETGWFALDGGAMFGVVPRALWERKIPADERNRVGLALRTLLLRQVDGPRRVLVDTGIGQKWSAKEADMFAVDHQRLELERGLAEHGLRTGDITDVLLTHLHFDHAGGATRRVGEKIVPTFENATYHVQAANLAWAQNPTEKDRASYRPENFEALLREGVLQQTDGPGEWLPGIELILSDGHTRALQLPHVHGPEGDLVYCADLIPTAAHVPVPWVMAYDNFPLTTMEEKKVLLGRAADEGWVLMFEHDPFGPAARVARTDRGFDVAERIQLAEVG